MAYFKNVNVAPPCGFFFELNGEKVSARHFCDIERPVREMLRKAGLTCTVEEAVANYMCPRIDEADWMCTGSFRPSPIRPAEALRNSLFEVEGRELVPFDVVERRLRACLACPMHTRKFCVTCTGHLERVLAAFGGRRPKVPEDAGSGICKCCKAYESAIASVAYAPGENTWEGTPETCWRRTT